MQLLKSLRKVFQSGEDKKATDEATFHIDQAPSVEYLLQHREELLKKGELAKARGASSTASLYRMYEYFVIGFNNGLRTEIEYFFNKPWPVSEIPDPQDPDPQRYAILAVLPSYMTAAYNRLIERGLPRGAPAILTREIEDELAAQPKVLEVEPAWTTAVPKLSEPLVIPNREGGRPEESAASPLFLEKNIIAEEPHTLFV